MKIQFESGGGITGPAGRRSLHLDTDRLPAGEAATVQRLVAEADLHELAKRRAKPQREPRPDEVFYEITVDDNGETSTIEAMQRDMSPTLQPLVSWLRTKAAESH